VPPGGFENVTVEIYVDPGLRAGTYDTFAVIHVQEDGLTIHSEPAVTRVRS